MRSSPSSRHLVVLLAGGLLLGGGSLSVARAAGAAPPPSSPPVLVWQVSQGLWGTLRLEVSRAGLVTYHFKPVQPDRKEEHARLTLSPRRLKDLYAVMRDAGACYRQGRRKLGIPDESRPALTLHWQKLRCTVEMWDGEWFEDRKARVIAHALRKLIQRTKAAATLP